MLLKNIHMYTIQEGAANLHDVYRKLLHCWAKTIISIKLIILCLKNYYFILIFETHSYKFLEFWDKFNDLISKL